MLPCPHFDILGLLAKDELLLNLQIVWTLCYRFSLLKILTVEWLSRCSNQQRVDNLNIFIQTSDIPILLGCRWEASCVVTTNYKLPTYYPTEKLYQDKNLTWPDIPDFQNGYMQFIILSQVPFIYAPATISTANFPTEKGYNA